jgi:nitronate monooxygenase
MDLSTLREPIVQAPMAGGVSTVELAAAVANAGGLGFLAAGYLSPDSLREEIQRLRALTDEAFGVNLFAPPAAADSDALERYAVRLRIEAERYGVSLGTPRHDDDALEAKLEVVAAERVPIVSFTFGCPRPGIVARLHDTGGAVWVTVTSPEEAAHAQAAGADALVVQGIEAGAHRGSFIDVDRTEDLGLLAALRLVAHRVALPLIAAGGIADGEGVAAVLCAGALAAQIGTALMLTDEAGTSQIQREAISGPGVTAFTRAFTGRRARGVINRFAEKYSACAPAAYPDVHHLTAPLRAAARERGDREAVNLWAGQARLLAREEPAGEIVRRLGAEAREAIRRVSARFGQPD